MATNNTDNRLQDLNAMTIGKLVLDTAQVYVIVDMKTSAPHIPLFFSGMLTRLSRVLLYRLPIIHVTRVGKKTRIALSCRTVCYPVVQSA